MITFNINIEKYTSVYNVAYCSFIMMSLYEDHKLHATFTECSLIHIVAPSIEIDFN